MLNGHNGTGGLQNHSLGGLYPYTVRVVERDGMTFCQAFNCITGYAGTAYHATGKAFKSAHDAAEAEAEIFIAVDGRYAH